MFSLKDITLDIILYNYNNEQKFEKACETLLLKTDDLNLDMLLFGSKIFKVCVDSY